MTTPTSEKIPAFQVIPLIAKGSLLSKKGFEFFVQCAEKIFDSKQHNKIIILAQQHAFIDETSDIEIELDSKLVLENLKNRIRLFRSILHKIKAHKWPIVYAGTNHCLDSNWELALACHYRVWFSSPQTKLGFSNMNSPYLPLGGVLEESSYLLESPKISLEQAKRHKIIDYWGGEIYQLKEIFTWLRQHTKDRSILRTDSSIPSITSLKIDFLRELEKDWVKSKHAAISNTSNSINYIKTIDKSKPWFRSKNSHEEFISYTFGRNIIRNITNRSLPNDFTGFQEISGKPPSFSIYINCTNWFIPLNFLVTLLKTNIGIIFYSKEGKTLLSTLERIYFKLEHLPDKKILRDQWSNKVSWFVAEHIASHCLSINGNIGDILEIEFRKSKLTFLEIVDPIRQEPCLLERLDQDEEQLQIPPEIQQFLAIIKKGVVFTNRSKFSIPLSSWIRLVFLNELIRVSIESSREVDKFLALLRSDGWAFASSQEAWNYFLQTRQSPKEGQIHKIDLLFPLQYVLDLGKWKHVVSLVKNNNIKKKEQKNKITEIHFSLFASYIGRAILKNGLVDNKRSAELLVEHSLGFPKKYGSLSHLIKFWGVRRFEQYTCRFWRT